MAATLAGGGASLDVDERSAAGAGDLGQDAIPLFERAQLQNLRIGAQRVGFDADGLGLSQRFGDSLVGLELDLFELILGGQRRLLRGDLGLDGAVEGAGEAEIHDIELVHHDAPGVELWNAGAL